MNDILVDAQNNPKIIDGDFVIGWSNDQHLNHIAMSSKGEYKRNPEIGSNLIDLLSDDSPKEGINELKRQLEYDGATVAHIELKDGQLVVDASYKD